MKIVTLKMLSKITILMNKKNCNISFLLSCNKFSIEILSEANENREQSNKGFLYIV